MLDLNDFFYFVQIVDRGGITSASRSLNVPKSTISHRLSRLENDLGVKLINRTTRQLKITEIGKEFYHHAVLMLREAEAAEISVRKRLSEPSGVLRFTTAVATAQFVMKDMVHEFLSLYPKIDVVQHVTDDFVDIVGEGFDVAIRAHPGPLKDSNLIQKKLAPAPWYLFANPSYLNRYGEPQKPDDLTNHTILYVMRPVRTPELCLRHETMKEVKIPFAPRLMSGDMAGVKEAARAGLGVAALPGYVCREEALSGELIHVLPSWTAESSTFSALMPYRHMVMPSVRVFLNFLSEKFPEAVTMPET